jgi:non-lysosomal glucosylceramidase
MAAATHLILEGFVEEGVRLVRAVRDRHDGHRRSPWNEVECGNHYARSLASWGLVVALAGADFDAHAGSLVFRPRLASDDLRLPFTAGTGWGELRLTPDSAEIEVLGGDLDLRDVAVHHPRLGLLTAGPVRLYPHESHQLAPTNQPSREDHS